MTAAETLTHADLAHFHCTDNWYPAGPLFKDCLYSDGIDYLAEKAGAYWLIDAIFSHHVTNRKLRIRGEQYFWTLKKTAKGWTLLATDGGKSGNGKKEVYARQHIPYSDFPLDEITVFVGPRWVQVSEGEYDQKGFLLTLMSER